MDDIRWRAACRSQAFRNPILAHGVILFLVGAPAINQSKTWPAYLATDAWAAAIFAFTASRLKLAPFCIGGNSIAVIASFSTCC